MVKRFCDICKKEIKEENRVYSLNIIRRYTDQPPSGDDFFQMKEICSECKIKIMNYIKVEAKDLSNKTFGFNEVIKNIRAGEKVARKSWDKGVFIYSSLGSVALFQQRNSTEAQLEKIVSDLHIVSNEPHSFVKNWCASLDDVLATDWLIVE